MGAPGTPVALLLVENHWRHVREHWETVWQFAQCMQYVWVTQPSLGVWGSTILHKPIDPQRGRGKLHTHGVGRPELQAWFPGCMTQAGPSLFKDLASGVNGKFLKPFVALTMSDSAIQVGYQWMRAVGVPRVITALVNCPDDEEAP